MSQRSKKNQGTCHIICGEQYQMPKMMQIKDGDKLYMMLLRPRSRVLCTPSFSMGGFCDYFLKWIQWTWISAHFLASMLRDQDLPIPVSRNAPSGKANQRAGSLTSLRSLHCEKAHVTQKDTCPASLDCSSPPSPGIICPSHSCHSPRRDLGWGPLSWIQSTHRAVKNSDF